MPKIKDLSGRRFGRLTATRISGRENGHVHWNVVCDCGTEKSVKGIHLSSGSVVSCGCYTVEKSRQMFTTHGLTKTPGYHCWMGMKTRCYNKNDAGYWRYGGRGISVCDRWRHSFEKFWEDMGPTREPGLSIDRINNDGNYEPENCRWADIKTQNRNTRQNVLIDTPKWGRVTVAEAAERLGMKYMTLRERIRRKWPIARALSEPVRIQ